MNVSRIRMQDAYIGSVAQKIAAKYGPLPEEYGDALARTPSEAEEELYRINAERKTEYAMSR